jgi:hypothetical protein
LNTKLKIFWWGMFIYAVSFCLVALGETKSSPGNDPLPGFACAFMALILPFMHAQDALLHHIPFPFPAWVYIYILICGWVNPVFIVAAVLYLIGGHSRAVAILRIVVLLMIPVTWIFAFYYLRTYPREGYFLWIIGMVMVLFSEEIARSFSSEPQVTR